MEQRISRWGVGPLTFVPSVAFAVAALAATFRWPGLFELNVLPGALLVAGIVLASAGIAMMFAGGRAVMRAYSSDRLVTTGIFAMVRHPIYAAWIVLIFPGAALLARSWPMLFAPFLAYAVFRALIHREEDYLERRFGQEYLDYRRRVNMVWPMPRFRAKKHAAARSAGAGQ